MIKRLFILLSITAVVMSQSGFDILSTPTDSRDAALGLTLNPTVKPTRIITHPESAVTLSVWNWVADVQGAFMGVALENAHFSFQALNSGELEYRNDIPSDEPLSTFQYNIFNTGGAYAQQFGEIVLGVGAEIVYERTLNASSKGLSINLAAAYPLNDKFIFSAGLRHIGITDELDDESSDLPSEIWTSVDANFNNLKVLAELNSGSIPNAFGVSYTLMENFEFMGGLQVESADSEMRLHPSAGFSAKWTSFTLGYSIYQMNHNLGPRHFISLFWNY